MGRNNRFGREMRSAEKTGLPMMDCKKRAGRPPMAICKRRLTTCEFSVRRSRRSRPAVPLRLAWIAIFSEIEPGAGSIIDLRCESAPVANNEHFIGLANDLALQLAKGPGAATPDELLDQPSPSHKGTTLRQQFDDLNNRIREKFPARCISSALGGPTAGYAHHNGASQQLCWQLENAASAAELARDICMHIVAMNPSVMRKEDLDPELVAKERDVLDQAMSQEAEKN